CLRTLKGVAFPLDWRGPRCVRHIFVSRAGLCLQWQRRRSRSLDTRDVAAHRVKSALLRHDQRSQRFRTCLESNCGSPEPQDSPHVDRHLPRRFVCGHPLGSAQDEFCVIRYNSSQPMAPALAGSSAPLRLDYVQWDTAFRVAVDLELEVVVAGTFKVKTE